MKIISTRNASVSNMQEQVRSIVISKIYFAWRGRNAWWSTWSTKYYGDCLHTDFESAKNYCERHRVQGTVFYIDELPVLTFQSEENSLFVSEINTQMFFLGFDIARLRSVTALLPVSTLTFKQIERLFSGYSRLWSHLAHKRVLISLGEGREKLEDVTRDVELKSYRSYTNGYDWPLGWSERPFQVNRTVLHSLCSALQNDLGR